MNPAVVIFEVHPSFEGILKALVLVKIIIIVVIVYMQKLPDFLCGYSEISLGLSVFVYLSASLLIVFNSQIVVIRVLLHLP